MTKLECSILVDKYEQDQKCSPNYVQQRLITAYQQSTAKQNAAKSIRTTYLAMLDILEKVLTFVLREQNEIVHYAPRGRKINR